MSNLLLCLCLVITTICSSGAIVYGQCRVIQEGFFRTPNKRVPVRLLTQQSDTAGTHKVIVFQNSLRVNTDGAQNSYHPQDLTGSRIAINNICNGVSVTRNGVRLSCQQARRIFERFRDNNFTPIAGHRISWQNVIAPTTDNLGRTIPCIFRSGEFRGYFGSLTTLKNGLSAEAGGECGSLNQLDQRVIPAFVLPGGQNILTTFGAAIGDLLIAFNPRNNVITAAVVGDVGPANKLGEGSVALNMTLLGRTEQPKTYQEALRLDTGTHEMSIAIIPNSRTFNLRRPFSKENLSERVQEWLTRAGFETQQRFVDFLRTCNN